MKKILTTAICAAVLVSCKKDKNEEIVTLSDSGLIVLNEGIWGMNNASITYYDFETETVSQDVFFNQNGRKLGDVGNDILVYGGKIYISVGGSSTLEITDLTLKSIKQISFDGSTINAQEPHGLAAHEGKIYVACFDGKVARLDTATLSIEKIVEVGKNPECICISSGFLYASNSGGLDYLTAYDSTVSVVDLETFTEVKKIVVSQNPFTLGVDANGDVIVGCRGNYADIPYSLHRINTTTNTLEKTFSNITPADFVMKNSLVYAYNYDWGTFQSQFIEFDTQTDAVTKPSFIADPSLIVSPYAINLNRSNEDIYISDALDYSGTGKVFVFDKTGVKRFEFTAGLCPKKVVVL